MLISALKSVFRRPKRAADRAFVFCTAYFSDAARYRRWIDYYLPRMGKLGVGHLILIDDGSPTLPDWPDLEIIRADDPLPDLLPPGVYLFTFRAHLGRSSISRYPGWWRSFLFSWKIADTYGFARIVHLESDCYALSEAMFRFIRETRSGWTAPWCRAYGFAETGFQIIGADALEELGKFYRLGEGFYAHHDRYAELTLPFTHLEKSFAGDRFGENVVRERWGGLPASPDYVANATAEFIQPYLLAKR